MFVDDMNKQMRESIQKRGELNQAADVEKRQVNECLAKHTALIMKEAMKYSLKLHRVNYEKHNENAPNS